MKSMTAPLTHRRYLGILRIAQVFADIGLRWHVSRDIQRLEKMSDHMLRDIGIPRNEIGHVVRYGRRRDG